MVVTSKWENEDQKTIKRKRVDCGHPDAKTCDRPKLVPKYSKSGARMEQRKKDYIDRNSEHYKSQASEKMDDQKRTWKKMMTTPGHVL
jgi:hypothetical protein